MQARIKFYKVGLFCLFLIASGVIAQPTSSWLDQPIYDWNRTAIGIPAPGKYAEHDPSCNRSIQRPVTAGEQQIAAKGWKLFERESVGRLRLVTAVSALTYQCRPFGFQVFLLWDDHMLGTLSPVLMDARSDSSIRDWVASDYND